MAVTFSHTVEGHPGATRGSIPRNYAIPVRPQSSRRRGHGIANRGHRHRPNVDPATRTFFSGDALAIVPYRAGCDSCGARCHALVFSWRSGRVEETLELSGDQNAIRERVAAEAAVHDRIVGWSSPVLVVTFMS